MLDYDLYGLRLGANCTSTTYTWENIVENGAKSLPVSFPALDAHAERRGWLQTRIGGVHVVQASATPSAGCCFGSESPLLL